MTPEELLYTKTHEWVRVETDPAGEKMATVGLTPFALEMLSDLVHVELAEVGRAVTAGEPLGEIESAKAVSDLYSPVTGEIVDVNLALEDMLQTLADDPYETGWFVKIKITDASCLSELLDLAAYRKQCEEERD